MHKRTDEEEEEEEDGILNIFAMSSSWGRLLHCRVGGYFVGLLVSWWMQAAVTVLVPLLSVSQSFIQPELGFTVQSALEASCKGWGDDPTTTTTSQVDDDDERNETTKWKNQNIMGVSWNFPTSSSESSESSFVQSRIEEQQFLQWMDI